MRSRRTLLHNIQVLNKKCGQQIDKIAELSGDLNARNETIKELNEENMMLKNDLSICIEQKKIYNKANDSLRHELDDSSHKYLSLKNTLQFIVDKI